MSDESFYERALLEYDAGEIDKGLLAKAYVAANGADDRLKLEYMKLRVAQLKGGARGSLRRWYRNTSHNERGVHLILSTLLIPLFGLGVILLIGLIWLAADERNELKGVRDV